MKKRNIRQGVLPDVFLILFVVVVYFIFSTMNKKVNTLTYDEFIKDLNAGEVTELEITPKERSAVYTLSGKLKGYEENETFTLNVPYTDAVIDDILNEEESITYICELPKFEEFNDELMKKDIKKTYHENYNIPIIVLGPEKAKNISYIDDEDETDPDKSNLSELDINKYSSNIQVGYCQEEEKSS